MIARGRNLKTGKIAFCLSLVQLDGTFRNVSGILLDVFWILFSVSIAISMERKELVIFGESL